MSPRFWPFALSNRVPHVAQRRVREAMPPSAAEAAGLGPGRDVPGGTQARPALLGSKGSDDHNLYRDALRHLELGRGHVLPMSSHDPEQEQPGQDPCPQPRHQWALLPQSPLATIVAGVPGFPQELRAQASDAGSGERKAAAHFRPRNPAGSWERAPRSRLPPPLLLLCGTGREAAGSGLAQSPTRKGSALLLRDRI